MEIAFEKIPYENYLAFFLSKMELPAEEERWIRIQYDYLKEPSWIGFNTYEIYCPFNISIKENSEFTVPTGFRCISEFKKVTCALYAASNEIRLTREETTDHIVIRGTLNENHCFQNGDKFLKLKFFG